MRKRFWTFWSLLVIVLAISYAWPFAYDLQLTKTVWVQGLVTHGGVRFITIQGDSSATVLANDSTPRLRIAKSGTAVASPFPLTQIPGCIDVGNPARAALRKLASATLACWPLVSIAWTGT